MKIDNEIRVNIWFRRELRFIFDISRNIYKFFKNWMYFLMLYLFFFVLWLGLLNW